MEWKTYTPTGIVDGNGVFNPKQLHSRKNAGYLPAIVIRPGSSNNNVIKNLVNYLSEEKVDSFVFHGSGDIYGNGERVKKSIDFCRDLNDEFGSPVVKKIVFKAGSLNNQKQEREKRNSYELFNGSVPSFDAKMFLEGWGKISETVNKAVNYAKDDLDFIIRVVHTENYATTEYLPELQEPEHDKRWLGTTWLPNPVNQGDVGTILDVDSLTEGGIAPSIDRIFMTEHLSNIRNFEKVGEPKDLDEYQEEVLDRFGIYIPGRDKGPVIFKEPIDATSKIREWGDRVKIAYFAGCLGEGMHFKDIVDGKEVYKIASLMPILNEKDNCFIEDPNTREDLVRKSKNILRISKRALEDIGCKEAVINTHIGKGVHDGLLWECYQKKSLENLRSL